MNRDKEIEIINKHIQELVYEKIQLRKAYNYYHCIRDAEQYRHIEENYGIGSPTSVGFTPLVKKHIDVLVGEYLELDPDLQISCKDSKTVGNIMREKKLEIDTYLYNYLKGYLENSLMQVLLGEEGVTTDPYIEGELKKIKDNIDDTFVSEYEIAAQNILAYVKRSRDLDLKNKMRELFTDLLITGICYYRVKPTGSGTNVDIEILNPLDTFIERNRNEFFLNKSQRVVIRKWMTEYQILEEYGEELSPEAIKSLHDQLGKGGRTYGSLYVRSSAAESNGTSSPMRQIPSPGILGGLEATPILPWDSTGQYNYQDMPVIGVHIVEWLEYDKKNDHTTRKEGIKIGEDIYVIRGESKYLSRSESRPKEATLSVNGLFFLDKNGSPFSVMLSTMDLQDRYDLLHYYRDNLIATSGTVGDWVDAAHLPDFLGEELPERIMKWIAYGKNGIKWFDSSQEGTQVLNTTFNGYDDTVKVQGIQAIQLAIEAIEQQVASITGVFPEKLGGIQQRDAVSNVKVGIKYSTLLTKQYFSAMDSIYKEINYDLLNLAKIVFKKGVAGSFILGNKYNSIFTALPEHYTTTDYDIHIQDSTETFQTMQDLKMLNVEFIRAGLVDAEMVIKILKSKNLTELSQYIEKATVQKKEENNQTTQMQQQIQELDNVRKQLEQQVKDAQYQLQQKDRQLERAKADNIEIERKRVAIEEKEARDRRDFNDKTLEIKNKQVQAEVIQLYDSNPNNNEIKNI